MESFHNHLYHCGCLCQNAPAASWVLQHDYSNKHNGGLSNQRGWLNLHPGWVGSAAAPQWHFGLNTVPSSALCSHFSQLCWHPHPLPKPSSHLPHSHCWSRDQPEAMSTCRLCSTKSKCWLVIRLRWPLATFDEPQPRGSTLLTSDQVNKLYLWIRMNLDQMGSLHIRIWLQIDLSCFQREYKVSASVQDEMRSSTMAKPLTIWLELPSQTFLHCI